MNNLIDVGSLIWTGSTGNKTTEFARRRGTMPQSSTVNRINSIQHPVAVLVCAVMMYTSPAFGAGPPARVIRTEMVSQTTSVANLTYGPASPDCNAVTGVGSGCAFVDYTYQGSGKDSVNGPYSFTGTGGFFFGVSGANITPSGAHDANGNSIGGCMPAVGDSHSVYRRGGTIDASFRGQSCCVGNTCNAAVQLGPVSAAHYYGTCTGGTGRFAGIECTEEMTYSSSTFAVGEVVIVLPGK